jgi:hypothetical protein
MDVVTSIVVIPKFFRHLFEPKTALYPIRKEGRIGVVRSRGFQMVNQEMLPMFGPLRGLPLAIKKVSYFASSVQSLSQSPTYSSLPPPSHLFPIMSRVHQMLDAATTLSSLLTAAGIPHAFYGGFTSVALGSPRETEVNLLQRNVYHSSIPHAFSIF